MSVSDANAVISPRFGAVVVWIITSTFALLVALSWSQSSITPAGELTPMGHDDFYQAARILHFVNSGEVLQFDDKIHAPEGSWLTWPWAYTALVGTAVLATSEITGADSETVLAHIPPVWFAINIALFIAVGRVLGFSARVLGASALLFSMTPVLLFLHAFYKVDHHIAELSFVLMALFWTVKWGRSGGRKSAVTLGGLLGAATAFHNGLFILQVPILIFTAYLWWNRDLRRSSATWVGLGLVAGTFVGLAFSEPFRAGVFAYQYHSWFHAYVAVVSAALLVTMAKTQPSVRTAGVIGVGCVVAAIVAAPSIVDGAGFLSGGLESLSSMDEVASPLREVFAGPRPLHVLQAYGACLVLAPFVLIGAVYILLKSKDRDLVVLAAFSVVGVSLMLMQQRLHYFGIAPLLLLTITWAVRRAQPVLAATVFLFLSAGVISGIPLLLKRPVVADNPDYQIVRPLYELLSEACASSPGVVLADQNDGHPIRYHTGCSVVANNFILTEQHERKIQQVNRLMSGSFSEMVEVAPFVDYILVRRADPLFGIPDDQARKWNPGLRRIFFGDQLPPCFQSLGAVSINVAMNSDPVIVGYVLRRNRKVEC